MSKNSQAKRDTKVTMEGDQEVYEKKPVHIKVVFLKIEDVNTLQEEFVAEVFVRARWREPSLDHCRDRDLENIVWSNMWQPKLVLQNLRGEPKANMWHEVQTGEAGEAYVMQKRRLKGTFTEKMELQDFPFDVQDLSLLLVSELSVEEVELLEETLEPSIVSRHSFVDEQEWHLMAFVESEQREPAEEFSNTKNKKPGLFFRCCAIRRPGFFIWNIIMIIALICSLSLSTFAVDRSLPQNRMQLTFILLLTGITFKFVASQSLPKISYLTHLDRYILLSMFFMFLVCMWHAIITRFAYNTSLADTMDNWAFRVFAILYGLFQIIFAVTMVARGYTKRKDANLKERAYLEKVSDKDIKGLKKVQLKKRQTRNRLPRIGAV